MTMHEAQRRLAGFSLEQSIVDAVNTTSRDVAVLIKTQLAFGTDGNGDKLKNRFTGSENYSVMWGEYRQSLNLQTDFFDLKVTGEFVGSIYVRDVTPVTFDIHASSNKTPDLIDMFGKEILNLSDVSRAEYVDQSFYPELKYRIESNTGLKFE